MKHISRFTLLAAMLLTLVAANSCSTSQKTIANSQSWLPSDFDPEKTVLLVQSFGQGANPVTIEMIAYMKEKYPFKYKFVSQQEIENLQGQYSDTNLYPYALVWNVEQVTFGRNKNKFREYFDLNFYSRKGKKDYPYIGKTTTFPKLAFKPVINTLVKKFG